MGGLDRLGDDAAQVRAQRLEVELVAQPRAERLERARRVVAAAVEAPVDERLDARSAGRNSAATASVETATAKPDSPTARLTSSTQPR